LKALVVSTETLIAVKLENDTLKLRLDRHKEFASIKRMCRHYRQNFDWLPLRHASQLLELPIRKVYDANYGHVNAYHADVWREAYALEIPNGLSEER
jgi:hypothetical protein